MRTILFASIILCITTWNIQAQTINKPKLDSLFESIGKHDKFMGSIAISAKGKPIYANSIGFCDVDSKQASTTDTKYRIGSISKMFTAVMVFQAIEDKKLSLDAKLEIFFPQIENSTKITISDMLYHRSGIHSFTSDPDYLEWNTQFKNREELLKIMASAISDFEPGSKTEYSNCNFVLLAYILEDIYNKPYNILLDEKIVHPAGLTSTYYGKKTDILKNECYSYNSFISWEKETETDMSIPGGAGAIVSSPTDLVRFIEALFTGKLISSESLDQMTTIDGYYGRGIFQIPFYEKQGWGHTGAIDAFFSLVVYYPEDSLAMAICSNGKKIDFNSVSIGALSCYYQKPYEIPVYSKIVISNEEMAQYTGIYSSLQIPLKIRVQIQENSLTAQAEGQEAFVLEPAGNHLFKFELAGVVLEFDPTKGTMILKQGGAEFTFTN